MRLFLDANILFSAAYREGSSTELLFQLAAVGRCELVTSAFALVEVRRNIAAKRSDRSKALEALIAKIEVGPEPGKKAMTSASSHGLPDKDVPILAAAIASKASTLVTGDRTHFGHLFGAIIESVKVLTLSEALSIII